MKPEDLTRQWRAAEATETMLGDGVRRGLSEAADELDDWLRHNGPVIVLYDLLHTAHQVGRDVTRIRYDNEAKGMALLLAELLGLSGDDDVREQLFKMIQGHYSPDHVISALRRTGRLPRLPAGEAEQ